MRKSFAPSQCSNSKHASSSQFKSPLQAKRQRVLQESTANNTMVRLPTAEHDEIIANILKRPFKVPIPNYVPDYYNSRCLGIKRTTLRRPLYDPTACNALVLYSPPDYSEHKKITSGNDILVHVVVDPIVTNVLRPHQREGVKFMYDCVTGARGDFHGCIMADEMGLGKTLQCVTLVWTLLQQSPECKPAIRNCIIVSPSSLVKNWQKEFDKWLYGRLNCLVMDKGTKDEISKNLEQFISSRNSRGGVPILIISYESFRLYANILNKSEIGLVICDEGHRLKNNDNLTYQALMCLQTKKRVLLSGTPIQNDLTEYYSLVNFVNPGMLGTKNEFGRRFELPILRGQNADCTDKDKALASERTAELLNIVNQCIIRRTNQINTKYLPVKFEMVICVKMTPFQEDLYKKFIKSDAIRLSLMSNTDNKKGSLSTLADITCLKKLCNHPNLVYDKIINKESGFNNVGNLPANYNPSELNPEFGGKVMLLDYMLASIKANTDDKVVLISNYTQTLDLFEQLCRKRKYTYVRLDGSMTIKKRSKIVDAFNDADSDVYIFMLSSKAGGCGLNLIGGNRLFMFDPDWNPANDEQAMARVWRDGQKKTCYTYRFVMTGTIEEKIFQRQTHKKSLSSVIVDNEDTGRYFTKDDLKDLFLYEENTISDTHQKFKCNRCLNGIQIKEPDESTDNTSHLSHWYHCSNNKGLPDTILSQSWSQSKTISFVFHHRSKGVKTS